LNFFIYWFEIPHAAIAIETLAFQEPYFFLTVVNGKPLVLPKEFAGSGADES